MMRKLAEKTGRAKAQCIFYRCSTLRADAETGYLYFFHPLQRLPRKEVIQPQLPLQLPCYDFVPVIGPALSGCVLAVHPPTSGVTNSHDVTGGVYKARERIHRAILMHGY